MKVDTEDGLTGWGEAFSYNCRPAVKAAVERMIAPVVVGLDSRDIAGISRDMQQKLHLFGRYGITIFALSGLDIALWDIAAKRANAPLHQLLGGAARQRVTGYASLLKYRDRDLVAENVTKARREGYEAIKIHETEVPEIAASRRAAGEGIPLMVDTNCPWTPEEARQRALRFLEYDLHWLEEPIFPPEDFDALATAPGLRLRLGKMPAPLSNLRRCSTQVRYNSRNRALQRLAASPRCVRLRHSPKPRRSL